MEAAETSVSCPACGHELPNDVLTVALGSNDPDHLRRLFGDELHHVRCDACGALGDAEPTVVIGFDEPPGLLVSAPPSLPGREVLLEALHEQVGDRGTLDVFTSVAALREAVAERLRPRVERLRELLESPDLEANLSSNWPHFTPDVFSAAALALDCPGHGLDLPNEAADTLAWVQAEVWWLLSLMWMSSPDELRLEDLLNTFVDDSTPLPGTLEALDRHLDETDDDEPWVVHYSQEALRATAHRLAGVPNPRRLDWATLFAGFELALRTGQWEEGSALLGQAVSAERAAATIDVQSAWVAAGDALRRKLGSGEPDDKKLVDVLTDICAKAGHPGLVAALLDLQPET